MQLKTKIVKQKVMERLMDILYTFSAAISPIKLPLFFTSEKIDISNSKNNASDFQIFILFRIIAEGACSHSLETMLFFGQKISSVCKKNILSACRHFFLKLLKI